MDNVTLKVFIDNPIVQLSGYLIGVISLLLAVVFYIRSKREKRPRFAYFSVSLIGGVKSFLPDLSIQYKGKSCTRVTATRFYFWNAGREPLKRSDIPPSSPLRIESNPSVEILGVEIVGETDVASQLSASAQGANNGVRLDFEYLDRDDGAVIQIIHAGTTETRFSMIGKIIGAESIEHLPAFRETEDPVLYPKRRKWYRIAFYAVVAASLVLPWLWLKSHSGPRYPQLNPPPEPAYAIWPYFAICVGIAIFLAIGQEILDRPPVPKRLRKSITIPLAPGRQNFR